MSDYKKRGKKGWESKKFAKKELKGRERQYGQSEIKEQLEIEYQGDAYRHRGGAAKKKLTKLEKINKKMDWCKKALDYWNRPNVFKHTMVDRMLSSFRSALEKLRNERNDL